VSCFAEQQLACQAESGSDLRQIGCKRAGNRRQIDGLCVQLLHTAERLLHGDRSAVIRPTSQNAMAVPDRTIRACDQLSAVR